MNIAGKLLGLVMAIVAVPLQAEERIALVMGNSAYSSVTQLDNPSRDASVMAETLGDLGFEVTVLIDATQQEMRRGISQFGRNLRDAGADATGLFYYAGHGVQSFGSNYLLPVDVALTDAADLDLVAIEAQSVLRQMFSARNRTNIMILDACRNNPFTDIPDFNDNGLAEMKAPTGTFLAYATAPGGVALDGIGSNSPFTEALATQMRTPGQPIEQMFKQVRVSVLDATRGQQTPWDTSSLTSDFVFVEADKPSAQEMADRQLWASVEQTRDPVQIMLFLRAYPDNLFAGEAKALLETVMQEELTGVASAPAEVAPATPDTGEQSMFEAAQAEGSVEAWQAYLEAFPTGTFVEYAEGEIAALTKDAGHDPVGRDPAEPEPTVEVATAAPEPVPDNVTFDTPLTVGNEAIIGKSLAQIITASPMFPPVEGLPESFWKDQPCSNCHQWNQTSLCDQANTYLTLNGQRSLSKEHPFGGALKQNLKAWAQGGCK